MSGKYRRGLSFILSLALVFGMLPMSAVTAAAEELSAVSQSEEVIQESEALPAESEVPADSEEESEELPAIGDGEEVEPEEGEVEGDDAEVGEPEEGDPEESDPEEGEAEEPVPISYSITMPELFEGMTTDELAAAITVEPAGTEYTVFFWDMAGCTRDTYKEGSIGWAGVCIETEEPAGVSLNGRDLPLEPLDTRNREEATACYGEEYGVNILRVLDYVFNVPADGPEIDIELPELSQYISNVAGLKRAVTFTPENMWLYAHYELYNGQRYCRLDFSGIEKCPTVLTVNGEEIDFQTNLYNVESYYGDSLIAVYYDGALSLSIPVVDLSCITIELPEVIEGMSSDEYAAAIVTSPESLVPICTFFGSEDVTDTYAAGDTLMAQVVYEMERCPESLMVDGEEVTVETEEEALERYDGRGIFAYYAEGVLILLVPLATTPLGEAESITLPALTEGMTPERLLSKMRITPEEVNMISCTFLDADQQDQESYIPGETAWIGLLQDVRPEALTVNGEEIPLCAGVMEIEDYLDAGLSCGVDLMGQYGIFISLLEEGDEGACSHNIRVSVAHKDVTCTENGVEGGTYCARCGEGRDEAEAVIEAAGHTIQEGVTASDPTCTRDGFTGYTWCSTCFAILAEGETLPALGHDYVGHRCARCGQWEYGTPVLSAVENITGGVKVTWQAVSGAPQYRVFRREAGVKDWSRIGNTTGTTFTDTTAVSGKTYVYTVRVLSQDGVYVSAYNTTGLTILYLSSLKAALSNTAAGITVQWAKVAGAKGYYVYRKANGGSYAVIKTITDGSTVSYIDPDAGLSSGTTYTYAVRAYSGSTKGYFTAASLCYLKSGVITSLTNTTAGIAVNWAKVNGAEGYYLYRKAGSGSYAVIQKITSGSTVSYTDPDQGLSSGTSYTYAVRAYSGETKGYFTASAVYYLKSGTISSLANTADGIAVKWDKVTGAAGYYLYRKVSGGSYAVIKTITSGSTVSYTDPAAGLKNGTGYTYAVRPYGEDTRGDFTARSIYRLTGVSVASLTNSAAGKLLVKWTKDAGCAGYQVQYGTASDFTGAKTVTLAGNTTVSTTLSSLTKGKTYYVRIRTYKKTANGTAYYSAWSGKKSLAISK